MNPATPLHAVSRHVDYAPFPGFAAAAGAAVNQLNRQVPGMDLWLVTCVAGDRQLVVAGCGGWADLAPPGAQFSWQASFCVRMVTGQASEVAPSFAAEPAYRQAAIGSLARVHSYLGVPLLSGHDELFGTLCALAGTEQPDSLSAAMPMVSMLGRMLSTVLAGERAAHARSTEAAGAYALAERDPLTQLCNRRGFERAVLTEQGRNERFGTRSSVLIVILDPPQQDTDAKAAAEDDPVSCCAELLATLCQPGDVVARISNAEFAVLAVQADVVATRALQGRLRLALRTAQVRATVSATTCSPGEDLTHAWQRAERNGHSAHVGQRPAVSLVETWPPR